MSLASMGVLAAAAVVCGTFKPERWRSWMLMISGILAIYWLQPSSPVRGLDFWLPTVALALVIWVWFGQGRRDEVDWRETWGTLAVTGGCMSAIALNRYLPAVCCLSPSIPPQWPQVALALASVVGIAWGLQQQKANQPWVAFAFLALILAGLVVIKSADLAYWTSWLLRKWNGQQTGLASGADIRWLGASYLAFRLIHVLRDGQAGKLPAVTLREFLIYTFFFPAYTAGPIDRLPRFLSDLRREFTLSAAHWAAAGERLAVGVFQKFVMADTLALIALNPTNALQVRAGVWAWVLLYAYAFRIYLDFAGYTNIAIGLGLLVGIRLPENFDRPYLRSNLTQFWNGWHMSLTQWFRSYFFFPFSRWMRTSKYSLPTFLVILIAQLSTMILIGLWHGINWPFVVWGIWHGLGLFLHNRWAEWLRPRLAGREMPHLAVWLNAGGVLLTFHFVALGWVWFAMPSLTLCLQVFAKLFGV